MKAGIFDAKMIAAALVCCFCLFAPQASALGQSDEKSGKENAQKPEPKLRLVIRMEDKSFATFFNRGYLKADVPKGSQGKLRVIRVRSVKSFIDRPVEIEAETKLVKDVLNIRMTPEMMEEVRLHPLDIKVPTGEYKSVRMLVKSNENDPIVNDKENKKEAKQEPAKEVAAKDDSPFLYVRINPDKGLYGRFDKADKLTINAQFGEVAVDFGKIAGVRVANDENPVLVTIILENGDRLRGTIPPQEIEVETQWGKQVFVTSDIYSITRTKESKFETVITDKEKFHRLKESLQILNPPRK